MPLTDPAIRNAKPRERPYKLDDASGLQLVTPSGGKWWRLKYRFGGKAKLLSLGVYPQVSLKKPGPTAMRRASNGRPAKIRAQPARTAKATRGGEDSFEAVVREWHGKHASRWAPGHAGKIIGRFERDIFPWLGARPVREITAPELLEVLRRIEARGAIETAHRAHQNCGRVFRYAIATGRAERDPAAGIAHHQPQLSAYAVASNKYGEPSKIGPSFSSCDT